MTTSIERCTTAFAEVSRARSIVQLARFVEERNGLDADQIEATLDVVEMLCSSAIDMLDDGEATS